MRYAAPKRIVRHAASNWRCYWWTRAVMYRSGRWRGIRIAIALGEHIGLQAQEKNNAYCYGQMFHHTIFSNETILP